MRRTLALLCSALLALVAGLTVTATAAGADGTTLPHDPAARGYIGLCDESGRNISGGSVDAAPFVWKAVASQAPPAAYTGTGQNAVLAVYQPRPGVAPAQWSGVPLTAASFYSGSHPAAQATYADTSLASIISDYPAQVDGLYVLRMSFGKQNYGLFSASYPTTTIQVIGSTWRVVAGGTVDCAAATARSNEQLTGVAGTRETTPRTPASGSERVIGHALGASTAASTGSGSSGAATSTGPYSQRTVALDAAGRPVSSSSSAVWLWLLVPAAAVLALGALMLRRRARR